MYNFLFEVGLSTCIMDAWSDEEMFNYNDKMACIYEAFLQLSLPLKALYKLLFTYSGPTAVVASHPCEDVIV